MCVIVKNTRVRQVCQLLLSLIVDQFISKWYAWV